VSQQLEQDISLPRRLAWALVLPVALLLVVGFVLGYQILSLQEQARWVDESDHVLAKSYQLQKRILDFETGIRGFLLTDDPRFLEPLAGQPPDVLIAELKELTADNPVQARSVETVEREFRAWLVAVGKLVDGEMVPEQRNLDAALVRKQRMDSVRRTFLSIVSEEERLRQELAKDAAAQTRLTWWVFGGLLLATAIALGVGSRRQLSGVARSFGAALKNETAARQGLELENYLRRVELELSQDVQGELTIEELGSRVLKRLVPESRATIAAFYAADGAQFRRYAGHALDLDGDAPDAFRLGQGLVGQAISENRTRHVKGLPQTYLKLRSGTGQSRPVEIVIAPMAFEGQVEAVVELGFVHEVDARSLELLERIGDSIAVAVRSTRYKRELRELLAETQRQAEELQAQQEELRVSNEELEEQSRALKEAQARMETQHTELETTNENLSRQAEQLERQNDALLHAQQALAERSREAARANRYKSEFLANMSHELRTPLNSSLILAKLLADNKPNNLTPEQIKFAETIYSAGNDLLTLINDILDLSKIEAGKLDVHFSLSPTSRVIEPLVRIFEPLAKDGGLDFEVSLEGAPTAIETDVQRAQQILKNLLSNAFKFTEKGGVALRVRAEGEDSIAFEVKDTGVGIAEDQHDAIFEAFRQADGTTNRKFGGTGLGLSISRDLARLLGGDIRLTSVPGQGSLFTLVLPRSRPKTATAPGSDIVAREPAPVSSAAASSSGVSSLGEVRSQKPPALSPPPIPDDRNHLDPNRRTILIIDDDPNFAEILRDVARELQFQCVVTSSADEGVKAAARIAPSAVLLDMNLPDHSGLSVLDRLKHASDTRHIPVHVISVADYAQTALKMGAVGYLQKPASRESLIQAFQRVEQALTRSMRRILVVEDDPVQRDSICKLLEGVEVETVAVGSAEEALKQVQAGTFDCVVTDLSLPDASGTELLERMATDETYPFPPVIVYTGRSLTTEEEQSLRRYSDSIIVKGARSPERLLDEVTLFLHQVESELPPERQRMLREVRDREAVFEGRSILIVEDDVRNVFALSHVLEPKGAKVEIARNGLEALEILEKNPKIDLVLMDVMMPEMDGITATREIRKRPEFARLPIIALTAKAMKDDQDRCLEAGCNDFASKPLDVEMLLSLLRVWMPR
jgi:CheY-like chemotaxis protein/signal transduction histidine kinase/CHASE3 domain sensor protein